MPVFFNFRWGILNLDIKIECNFFRMRIYAGFTLSECACIMAGLGAYPQCSQPRPGQGPTRPEKLESAKDEELKLINFETVHNIDEWGSDFVPSMREALRCWNMTVQHWLVFTVYKRFPIKLVTFVANFLITLFMECMFRSLRTAMVMLVSSIWHGVHPGYYLSLGSVPLCLMVIYFKYVFMHFTSCSELMKVLTLTRFFNYWIKLERFSSYFCHRLKIITEG